MKINRHGRAKVPTRSKHGAPIHLVQATLGHSDITTTSRYLHARPDDSSAMYLP
ncbi:MAG TPA: tyrosine-type recombinase/integrase [Leptolyngbyaceae cyanobacterium]